MNELNSVQKNSAEISLDEVCYTPPFEDETHFLFCAEVPIISSEFFDAGVQDIKRRTPSWSTQKATMKILTA